MNLEKLRTFITDINERHRLLSDRLDTIDPASSEYPSKDQEADALLEALFLRFFTQYEADLEVLFLHYVTRGVSISGVAAPTLLAVSDEDKARRLVKAGNRFLSWAKPRYIQEKAETYMEHGWPFVDIIATNSQILGDCEKVRNRIAHQSIEAASAFAEVQRNLFGTDRPFVMSPGQLLRARRKGSPRLVMQKYVDALDETLSALVDPPP